MANNRLDFSAATKKIIASRAGYRCSFPGCNAQLIAPNGENFIELGECAHIYAAAHDGPRGVTHLSNEAIVSPDNGIYLCQAHHKLIDSAEGCKLYPAEELLRIKQRHEYKIALEAGTVLPPFMRIHSLRLRKFPLLDPDSIIPFTSTTILKGDNGVGKTAIVEQILGAVEGTLSSRWSEDEISVDFVLDNLSTSVINYNCNAGDRRFYDAVGKQLGYEPFDMEVFLLSDCHYKIDRDNDVKTLAAMIGIDEKRLTRIIESVDLSTSTTITNITIEEQIEEDVVRKKIKIVKASNPESIWLLNQLCGAETKGLILDLILAYMQSLTRYRNGLLLIDWGAIHSFDKSWMNKYLAIIQKTSNKFQTILTTHSSLDELNAGGWSIVDLDKMQSDDE